MKIISHRGNLEGPEPDSENNPERIDFCISRGFDVEIDLWVDEKSGKILLGHDYGDTEVDMEWLLERSNKLWIHCKNYSALFLLSENHEKFNFFWHDKDDYNLTSRGYIWAYPGKYIGTNCVIVMPEWDNEITDGFIHPSCIGICTDYPEKILEMKD